MHAVIKEFIPVPSQKLVLKGPGILFPFYTGKPISSDDIVDDDDVANGGDSQGGGDQPTPTPTPGGGPSSGGQPEQPQPQPDDPEHPQEDPDKDPDSSGEGEGGSGNTDDGDDGNGDEPQDHKPDNPGATDTDHVQVEPDKEPTEQQLKVGRQLKSATKAWISNVRKNKLPKLPKEAAKRVEDQLNQIESDLDNTNDADLEKLEGLYIEAENVNHGIKFYEDGIFRKDSIVVLPSGDGFGVNVFIKRIAKKVGSVDGIIYTEVIEDTFFPLYWNIGVKKFDQHHGTGYILFPGEYDSVDNIKKLFVCGIGTTNISEITKWGNDTNDDYVDWERVDEVLYDTVKTTQSAQGGNKLPSPSQSLHEFAKPRTYKELERFLQMNGADVHFSQDPSVQYARPSTDEILYYLELYKIK